LIIIGVLGFFKVENLMKNIVHSNKEVVVPNLTGLKFEEAKIILKKINLLIEKEAEVFDKSIKPDRVVSQFPEQDSIVREGRIIKVLVSKGGNSLQMPNIIDLEQREAEIKLKNFGLTIGQEEYVYSLTIAEGRVVEQSPEPESMISRGNFVNLKISKGLPPEGIKIMPNVLGLKKEVVEILLSTLDITFSFDFVLTNREDQKGMAIDQSVKPDQRIPEGHTVWIKIGA